MFRSSLFLRRRAGQGSDSFTLRALACLVFAGVLAGIGFQGLISHAHAGERLAFQTVIDRAKKLASKPFKDTEGEVPEFLLKLSFDEWRDLRFEPDKALWKKERLPFTIQFFHLGLYYNRRVRIHVVDTTGVHTVPFSTDLFDYGRNTFKESIPKDLGFAGFRIHYPINTKDYHDEVAVFLGASYLRAVAQDQGYGMSARGLSIDTALPSGEEFPYFKEFWIQKPGQDSKKITVYALLDSPSLTGAYRFAIQPGKETLMDVRARLFIRKRVEKLGIAPLTSMFFYGENTSIRPVDDFRPEVHDSDGLMIATGAGEWVWRPLRNPRTLQVNSFEARDPIGFGLIQRDLVFDHYQDLEARYERRPSVWVSPIGKWGDGRVDLIQIPTDSEINDNIIAFWVPHRSPQPGGEYSLSYGMSWHYPGSGRPPGGRVVATQTGKGKENGVRKFVLDFSGGRLESLPADKPLTAVVSVDPKARLIEQQLHKNRVTGGWRLVFQIHAEESGSMDRVLPPNRRPPIELRAFLKLGESALTETWSYAYQP